MCDILFRVGEEEGVIDFQSPLWASLAHAMMTAALADRSMLITTKGNASWFFSLFSHAITKT